MLKQPNILLVYMKTRSPHVRVSNKGPKPQRQSLVDSLDTTTCCSATGSPPPSYDRQAAEPGYSRCRLPRNLPHGIRPQRDPPVVGPPIVQKVRDS